jgi:hypothetical protein
LEIIYKSNQDQAKKLEFALDRESNTFSPLIQRQKNKSFQLKSKASSALI